MIAILWPFGQSPPQELGWLCRARPSFIRAVVLKTFVIIASLIPVALFLRSIVFRRSGRVRAAASAFDRQIGYLAIALVAIVAVSIIVFLIRSYWPA